PARRIAMATSGTGIIDAFASHAFLHDLPERHRMILAAGARPFRAEAGELLGREGDSARSFFLIQSGRVVLEMHRPEGITVPLLTVGPGDIIGWSWLVPPHRWQFDSRVLEPAQGIAFDGTWLRDRCEQNYDLGYHLLKQLI